MNNFQTDQSPSGWKFASAGVAAVLVFLATYSNSFHNAFHFDDSHVIVGNLFIRDLANVPRMFTDASTSSALPTNAVYRPLVTLTLAIDYRLAGGLNPVWFHITQLTLFLAIGVMLYLLYKKLFASTGECGWPKWAALFAATVFCLHTANAETANYISARSELLSGCGVLGAFLLYIYAPGSRRFYLYLIPLVAAVLAKTPAVMFAPLLLVYMLLIEKQLSLDEVFSRGAWPQVRDVLLRSTPVFAIAAGLYLFAEGMNQTTVSYGGVGRVQYLSTQTWVWVDYVRQFFFPSGLSADTGMSPFTTWANPRVFAGLVLLVLSIVAVWRASRTRELRPVAFGILWFWIALFPSSSIFPLAEVTNGHRVFFPYMGLTAAVVWWLAVRLRTATESAEARRRLAMLATIASILVVGVFAIATHVRNRVWLNAETLWGDVVKKSPNNGRGLMNYGLTQMALGRFSIAKDYFTRSSAMNPNYPYVYVNLAIVNNALGDSASADAFFERALQLAPNLASTHVFYAGWLIEHGRASDARLHLEQAITLSPGDVDARHALLNLYAASGDTASLARLVQETLALSTSDSVAREYLNITIGSSGSSAEWYKVGLDRARQNHHASAAAAYRIALKLDSTNVDALNNLGWSLAQLGYRPEAVVLFERTLRLKPDYAAAKANLAWARSTGGTDRFTQAFQLQTSGRSAEAVPIYRELLAQNPTWVNAHYNLGYALMALGRCPQAIVEFERVLALQPHYPLAHLHLSTCLGKLGRTADSVRHRAIYDEPERASLPPVAR